MSRRTVLSWLLLALAVGVGAGRDFVFVNLNYQLDFLEHHRLVSYAHSLFRKAVGNLDAHQLRLAKWVLAVAFSAAMLALAVAMARVRFGDHRYRRLLAAGFVAIGLLAAALQAGAAALPALGPVGVKLLHALQYPLPVALVWVLSWAPRH
jgi:hypothetical protein